MRNGNRDTVRQTLNELDIVDRVLVGSMSQQREHTQRPIVDANWRAHARTIGTRAANVIDELWRGEIAKRAVRTARRVRRTRCAVLLKLCSAFGQQPEVRLVVRNDPCGDGGKMLEHFTHVQCARERGQQGVESLERLRLAFSSCRHAGPRLLSGRDGQTRETRSLATICRIVSNTPTRCLERTC